MHKGQDQVNMVEVYTMKAEDIFRSSIGCEIMLMIKARIRLIFSRYTLIASNSLTKHAICICNAKKKNISLH